MFESQVMSASHHSQLLQLLSSSWSYYLLTISYLLIYSHLINSLSIKATDSGILFNAMDTQ